jgi:hypothetical protein
MAIWSLIPAIAGMASQAAGAEAGAAATVEGAKTQAEIQQMGTDFQREMLEKELEMTAADRAMGYAALPGIQRYVYGRQAPEGGLSRFRGELMGEALSDLRPEVQEAVRQRASAGEEEQAYGRLLDMARIGQGQAASAGQAYGGYSNALANLLMQTGARGGEALRQAAETRQGISTGIAGTLGDIPAYMKQQRYIQQQRQLGQGTAPSQYDPYGIGYGTALS